MHDCFPITTMGEVKEIQEKNHEGSIMHVKRQNAEGELGYDTERSRSI